MARFRGWIQAGAVLFTNLHLPNFIKGGIYQGKGKTVCVPGLNCYSCPAASGACPIGAFQAVAGSSKFRFSYYITGFLILLGVLLGRLICGFLCPFGWFQELLHRIPTRKLSSKKLRPLTYLKYVILLVMVVLLPAFAVNEVGMGDPFFCKYLCPQGAFYALFNKVSLLQMKVDANACISCGKCVKVCSMDVDVTKTPDHAECIRCGKCVLTCPTGTVRFRYGFGGGDEHGLRG